MSLSDDLDSFLEIYLLNAHRETVTRDLGRNLFVFKLNVFTHICKGTSFASLSDCYDVEMTILR